MEIALAVLLISSLTSVGLLSLWAATSRRHWLLRTSAFAAVLSLLLLIPAYGPLTAFAWQGCVIVVCMRLVRWTKGSDSIKPYQFSLATLLRLMTLTAVVFTVAIKVDFEALDPYASETVFCIGLGGGMATLIGYWIVRGRSIRLWLRIAAGLTSSVLLAFFFASGDWFVVSLIKNSQGFQNNFSAVAERISEGPDGGFFGLDEFFIWGIVGIGIVALTALLVGLVANVVLVRQQNQQRRTLIFLRVFAVMLLSPLVVVSYQLMTPLPIPVSKPLLNNGHKDLVLAAEAISIVDDVFDREKTSGAELRDYVKKTSLAYKHLSTGLTKEIQIPFNYHQSFITFIFSDHFDFSDLGQMLVARGQLAFREDRFKAALQEYFDVLRLGNAVRAQSLHLIWFYGAMINGDGYIGIYCLRTNLDIEQLKITCALLQQFEKDWESQQDTAYRDRIWKQNANGWFGHLTQILLEFNPPEKQMLWSLTHERAQSHLLCAELAVLAFHLEHGHLPERLEELVPKYFLEVPSDSHNPKNEPLQYRREGETFVLYSVGSNGMDNGGKSRQGKFDKFCDLLLSDIYAPSAPAVVTEDE